MSIGNHFLQDQRNQVNYFNYYYFTDAFTNEEIDKICEIGDKLNILDAVTGNNDKPTEYRTSNISWIGENEESEWIYKKVADYAKIANKEMWNFDIWGYQDSFQYTIYDGAKKGHYDWHADCGPNMSNRKLSCVLQLTDPAEYTGGDLEFKVNKNDLQAVKGKGVLVFFPSFVLHRVTPVESGIRKSLVTWLCGANLR